MSAFPLHRAPRSVPLNVTALLCVSLLLAGCSKETPKAEEVRPVRAMTVDASNVGVNAEFPGEVRARVESRLGFRVPGKITSRLVDAGSVVKRGQPLMRLDPQDLQLSQSQAKASLRAAETARDLAKAELKRFQELRVKNFVSQAVLDQKLAGYNAAQANVDAAQAGYFGMSNQANYATLVSDVDGVVTSITAEVGQVVSPGLPVVSVAKSGEKEIVIGLPEDKVDILRQVSDVTVRTWAKPDAIIPGKVREVSPMADPATRTYAARISIPDSAADVKLGMTALVQFTSTTAQSRIRVPLSALYHESNVTSVWVVENHRVKLVPVQLSGVAGNDVLVTGGIREGQTIVTAGVNLLKAGQQVTLLPHERISSAQQATSDVSATATPAGAAK